MNAAGQIEIPPIYDAIGEFKQFGYAVMQREGRVGLLGKNGGQIIPAKYDDIKVLDSLFVAVMDADEWMVINLREQVILPKGYQRVIIWDGKYLAFMKDRKWGIRSTAGQLLVPAVYDEISYREGFFQTQKSKLLGLLHPDGRELLKPQADDIQIYSDSLFFYKNGHRWGAVDVAGKAVIPVEFDYFKRISSNFIKLVANGKKYIYSIASEN